MEIEKKRETGHKILLFLIMAMCVGGCNMQNRFLYFPSAARPSSQVLEREGMKLWQETAGDYQGLVAAVEAPAPNGTIVLFHGNGGTALDRTFYVRPFMELGFRVILAEYPEIRRASGSGGRNTVCRRRVGDGAPCLRAIRKSSVCIGRIAWLRRRGAVVKGTRPSRGRYHAHYALGHAGIRRQVPLPFSPRAVGVNRHL